MSFFLCQGFRDLLGSFSTIPWMPWLFQAMEEVKKIIEEIQGLPRGVGDSTEQAMQTWKLRLHMGSTMVLNPMSWDMIPYLINIDVNININMNK